MEGSSDFRGRGWRFPIVLNQAGGFDWVDGDDNIVQSVELLLRTITGERVMRPTFGAPIVDFLFQDDGDQNLRQLELELARVVREHEPRVEIATVRATPRSGDDGIVDIDLVLRILRSNTQRNLVFPFY